MILSVPAQEETVATKATTMRGGTPDNKMKNIPLRKEHVIPPCAPDWWCDGWELLWDNVAANSDAIGEIALGAAEVAGGALLIEAGIPLAAGGTIAVVGSGGAAAPVAAPAAVLGVAGVGGGTYAAWDGSKRVGNGLSKLKWNNEATGPGGQNYGNWLGGEREKRVADLTGGTIPSGQPGKPGLKIIKPNVGSSDVDVIGRNGEYIAVGGAKKAKDVNQLKVKLGILKYAADQKGVGAQAYFEEGTPDAALDAARQVLGNDNVFIFGR